MGGAVGDERYLPQSGDAAIRDAGFMSDVGDQFGPRTIDGFNESRASARRRVPVSRRQDWVVQAAAGQSGVRNHRREGRQTEHQYALPSNAGRSKFASL